MAEYIEREATLKEAESRIMWGASASAVYESIEDAPAADVAPVRHAKVIDKISDDHETIKPWDYRYYCSACKIPMRDSWNKYCPNCGARMDGDKNA